VALIKPFKALRPASENAEKVSCPPYDVVSVAEAKEAAKGNVHSFFRITKPEIDLSDPNASPEEALTTAEKNLRLFIEQGTLVQDAEPSLYIYRLSVGGHSQSGVVACCSVDEYDNGLIKRHEQTREEKVKDRTDHMLRLRAQTGLIFLAYRGTKTIDDIVAEVEKTEPLYDFVCGGTIRNTIWKVSDTGGLVDAFADVPALYIADGHHRVASASRVRDELRKQNPDHTGDEGYNCFVAAMFPAEELQVLAYNRVIKALNDLSEADFLAAVAETFEIAENAPAKPERRGEFSMYLNGEWYTLITPKELTASLPTTRALDASVLHEFLIEPILGISDLQTDKRIKFVGGGRGTDELVRIVDGGKAKVAFSLYPASVDDLLKVSDAGEIMPPKSTWFEPKLRDGLLIHLI
jgi:uncharacterized protein (DUF1015 family)